MDALTRTLTCTFISLDVKRGATEMWEKVFSQGAFIPTPLGWLCSSLKVHVLLADKESGSWWVPALEGYSDFHRGEIISPIFTTCVLTSQAYF